jgi:hypothetical protein
MADPLYTLWRCADGTYDICEDGEVVRENVPASALLAAKDLVAVLDEIVGQTNPNRYGYDAGCKALDDDWRARARAALRSAKGVT